MLTSFLLLVFFVYSNSILLKRIGAFGCFDDCHTITTAYFMTRGRTIYSEIFSNHQVLMPVISYLVQSVISLDNSLYGLILVHRLVMMGISFLLASLLVIRFRWAGIAFLLLYEPIKFYLFGDRFLAEAIIPYLAAYLIGLNWAKYTNQKMYFKDFMSAAFFTWTIIFLREPYSLFALFTFLTLVLSRNIRKLAWKPIILFIALTVVTLIVLPFKDFIDNVFISNIRIIAAREVESKNLLGTGIVDVLFYPFVILFSKPTTILGSFQIIMSLIFTTLSFIISIRYKKYFIVLLIWIALAFTAVRAEPPGEMFFEAFHMLPWHGAFIMAIVSFLSFIVYKEKQNIVTNGIVVGILMINAYLLFSPRSFFQENIDTAGEFRNGYSRYQLYSSFISIISRPSDTLFIEQWDDIIYRQTNLESSYPYALYTLWNKSIPKYDDARIVMFTNNPPDIYYCSEDMKYDEDELIPNSVIDSYIQLMHDDEKICVFIHKSKFDLTTKDQWEKAGEMGFTYSLDGS